MKGKYFILFLVLVLAISAAAFFYSAKKEKSEAASVAASFFPVAEFVRGVTGEEIKVWSVIPNGVSEHDFEPSIKDIENIYGVKVFFINGFGIDAWAERLKPDLEAKGVKVINLSEAVKSPIPDKRPNPHFWLDPVIAEEEINLIQQSLTGVFPEKAEKFLDNAINYQARLSALDSAYLSGLRNCRLNEAIVSHDAFPYLGRQYNVNFLPILGENEEDEPSLKEMAQFINIIREKGIKFVFYEISENSAPAMLLAEETGSRALGLNSACGVFSEAKGKNYFSIMEENLMSIKTALECQ